MPYAVAFRLRVLEGPECFVKRRALPTASVGLRPSLSWYCGLGGVGRARRSSPSGHTSGCGYLPRARPSHRDGKQRGLVRRTADSDSICHRLAVDSALRQASPARAIFRGYTIDMRSIRYCSGSGLTWCRTNTHLDVSLRRTLRFRLRTEDNEAEGCAGTPSNTPRRRVQKVSRGPSEALRLCRVCLAVISHARFVVQGLCTKTAYAGVNEDMVPDMAVCKGVGASADIPVSVVRSSMGPTCILAS